MFEIFLNCLKKNLNEFNCSYINFENLIRFWKSKII